MAQVSHRLIVWLRPGLPSCQIGLERVWCCWSTRRNPQRCTTSPNSPRIPNPGGSGLAQARQSTLSAVAFIFASGSHDVGSTSVPFLRIEGKLRRPEKGIGRGRQLPICFCPYPRFSWNQLQAELLMSHCSIPHLTLHEASDKLLRSLTAG